MEVAAFNRLEEKIEAFLVRMEEFKRENSALREQLAAKDEELARLREHLATQDQERTEVRSRIEQLVLKLETY